MSHSHMVIYQTSDGEPGSRQFDEIMAAVAFVEELRNRSGVDVARIFKLEEVKFEFKPYYQVLVVEGDDAASADEVAAPQEAAAPAATEEAAPVAAEVAADAAPAAEPVVEAVVESAPSPVAEVAEHAPAAPEVEPEPAEAIVAEAAPEAVETVEEAARQPFAMGAGSDQLDDRLAGVGADSPLATRRGLFGR